MDRNDRLNPRLDEQAQHDTQGMTRSGRATRADESRDAEAPGEDQATVDRAPGGDLTGGTPPGMTEVVVSERAELARWLGKEVWPARRSELLAKATELGAPDGVLERLGRLPGDRDFANVEAVWAALGGHVETRRT